MCNETFCDFLVFLPQDQPSQTILNFSCSLGWSSKLSGVFSACKSLLFVNFIGEFAGLTIFLTLVGPFGGKKRRNGEKSCKITITISIKNRFINMASWLIPTWIRLTGFIRHTKWVRSGCQIPPTSWNAYKSPMCSFVTFDDSSKCWLEKRLWTFRILFENNFHLARLREV